jgi:hypothetical protein
VIKKAWELIRNMIKQLMETINGLLAAHLQRRHIDESLPRLTELMMVYMMMMDEMVSDGP